MKTVISLPIVKDTLAVLAIVFFVYLSIQQIAPFGSATSPDSIAYLETARNIATGKGIVIKNRDFDKKTEFVSMTAWPPLYPIALSLLISESVYEGPKKRIVTFFFPYEYSRSVDISNESKSVWTADNSSDYFIALLFFATHGNGIYLCVE